MKYRKILLAVFAAFALTFCAFAQDNTVTFPDVPEDAAYAQDVYKLVESGVINGYTDGTFKPSGSVTRAEMAKMIGLTFGYTDTTDAKGFPDVSEKAWYAPYALAAQKAGFVEGYEDGSFRPNELITREQVCAILCRITNAYDLPFDVEITDEISKWAVDYVKKAVNNRFMPLEEGNTFRAKEVIKRYELASALAKFAKVKPATPVTANVIFYVGDVQYGNTDTVVVGDYATLPENPTHQDETLEFAGWKIKGTEDTQILDVKSYMIMGDTEFEAVFKTKYHTVTFYVDGVVYKTLEVKHGENPTGVTNPSKDGFDFAGWSKTQGGTAVILSNLVITEDIGLYAKFESGAAPVITYYVRFYVDGEIFHSVDVADGSKVKAPTSEPKPAEEGLKFAGWSLTDGGTVPVDFSKLRITKNTKLYAIFADLTEQDILYDMLDRGYDQLDDVLDLIPEGTGKTEYYNIWREFVEVVMGCIDKVLKDADNGVIISKQYIKDKYPEDLEYAEYLALDELSGRQLSELSKLLMGNVDPDIQDFLLEFFNVELPD